MISVVILYPQSDDSNFDMDYYTTKHMPMFVEALGEASLTAEVVVQQDLWDLPARFNTVLFPASAHSDRELKLDMIEQGYHILAPGGYFITLSEYEKDSLFAKAQKKVFGKCGESPSSEHGTAFWSKKDPEKAERPRRRHEMEYHAKLPDGPPLAGRGDGERLELTHRATNRDLFARGALAAAKYAAQAKPGRYSIADVLGD